VPPAFAAYRKSNPPNYGPGTTPARILEGEGVIHTDDLQAEPAYQRGEPNRRAIVDLGGARSAVIVPLKRDEAVLGFIEIYRQEVRPFTGKQIALLQNFAAQAVIAIENARLITETREALDQQTATAEVLGVINASPGDLAPVFEAMLDKATHLCEAAHGALFIQDGERFRAIPSRSTPQAFTEFLTREPIYFDLDPERSIMGRTLQQRSAVQVADLRESEPYRNKLPIALAAVETAGSRTLLSVPMFREDVPIGIFQLARQEVRPFGDNQIALVSNFAAQAVIAIENTRLISETREALEQQTATAEVLGVINSSPGDLAPVFDAMLEKALRLCDAAFGMMNTYDGERFQRAADHGVPGGYAEYRRHSQMAFGPGTAPARIVAGENVIHNADLKAEEAYERGDPNRRALVDLGGARSHVAVALRKDGALLGHIGIYRQEVRPFSDKQIALLQNFAAQAVIAMENARLITETREALQQQTATAEVLGVINSSPGNLAPVFEAILEKAHSLCGIAFGSLQLYEAGTVRAVAVRGVADSLAELLRLPIEPLPGSPPARLMDGERIVQITDMLESAEQRPDNPRAQASAAHGLRTVLFVPLRKEADFLGYIAAFRKEVRPFSEKEIALLENFAAQAVIAMENARLITETRERTRDLQESLEYQTATSDVLKVISRSTFDLDPVLENVVETALRLCRAQMGSIFRLDEGVYHWAVGRGLEPAYQEIEMRTPILPDSSTLVGRAALARQAVQIRDAWTEPDYERKEEARTGRIRTMLGVPLLRAGVPIGVIAMARDRVEPFTDKQIELVTTFADQAVIAIENARLLNELRERTDELARSVEELKALSEVGQEVSSTLDLGAVLSTILNRSVALSGADAGAIFRYSEVQQAFRLAEAVGWDEELVNRVSKLRIAEHETGMGEATRTRRPLQLADLASRPSYPLRDATLAAGFRSVLIVPLVGADRVFGAIVLERRAAGEFPEAAVRLMQTLASQSVLAIQNARLFREIADKSEELRLASQHKSQFLANMSHELRTPLNAILGYTELMVDGIYGDLPEKAAGVLDRVQNNGKHLLALINDVLDLSKIEAGQLELTLDDYALPDVVQSVVTATEALASTKGLKMTADVAPGLPLGRGDARRLAQVLLNLVGNAVKFTDQGEVAIGARAGNGNFELTVRDTGPGIAPEDQGKIFEEFQQVDSSNTRKKGGTGLGLAISKRMVEMHGGAISVESEPGHGATFRVSLPIRVEEVADELAGELMGAA